MGKGIDLARADAPEHAAMIDDFKDQLLIAFMVRLCPLHAVSGIGVVSIPIKEIDETGLYTLSLSIDGGMFNFELRKKS